MPPEGPRKRLSAAHCAAISAALKGKMKGRTLTAEHKANIGAAQKGVPKTAKWLATKVGVPLSTTHRDAIRQGMREMWAKPEVRERARQAMREVWARKRAAKAQSDAAHN